MEKDAANCMMTSYSRILFPPMRLGAGRWVGRSSFGRKGRRRTEEVGRKGEGTKWRCIPPDPSIPLPTARFAGGNRSRRPRVARIGLVAQVRRGLRFSRSLIIVIRRRSDNFHSLCLSFPFKIDRFSPASDQRSLVEHLLS
ncbi:hypothetical protein GUJ93_ZPchr0006g44354 [Zizania palustris]|uniref:Uncharacterized protein n=1 Tax=Zizania palustris TaxID=103762 RepID=A0A8J5TE78_ZIZPA|nr:hypothetical protein GUJ93_ZPchr0006g44354 [Zizania palustris]